MVVERETIIERPVELETIVERTSEPVVVEDGGGGAALIAGILVTLDHRRSDVLDIQRRHARRTCDY